MSSLRADPEDPPETADQLFGREPELAIIGGLLEQAHRTRSGVLVLRGEVGVGKSALLGLALSSASGMQVLRVVGVEPESELAFAALHQLLRPVLPYIDRIPDAQADALRIAMGLAPGAAENRFIVALAVLSLLAEVALERPVLCLVDDAQWLDQPSSDALTFVARRVEAEGIVMLFSIREGDRGSFRYAGLPQRTVGVLDPSEAEDLLLERFGAEIAPEVRQVIVGSAQGLPLALLEIPASLTSAQLSGRDPLPRPMPIGRQLEDLLRERVHDLPAPAQMLLLIAATEGSGEAAVILSAAATLDIPPSALLDAEASGLIHSEGSSLVFRHPIHRTAIYEGASLSQRQAAHRALAEILQGQINEDRRAWHRSALILYPDDEIADELERTADRARERGGPAAACAALRRSAELTTSDDRRARRLAAAARAAWDAGLPAEASVLLRTAEAKADVQTYAELRHVQGELELWRGTPLEGAKVLVDGAERVAAADPQKALRMLFDAGLAAIYAGEMGLLTDVGHRAATLTITESEMESSLVALLGSVGALLEANDKAQRERLLTALDRLADATEPRWLLWAGSAAAGIGAQARHDALHKRADAIARRSMAVGALVMVLERAAWTDMMTGRLAPAALRSEEGLQLALETGLTNSACLHRAILGWLAAIRGDQEACTTLAEQASEAAVKQGLGPHNSIANWAVGLLHLGLGRWEDAATRLDGVVASALPGMGHPSVARAAIPDLVEAAVGAGRPDVAESAADRFTAFARVAAPDWQSALAARCRALVTSSPEAREKLLSEALVFHERDRRPFDRARTLLLLGEHLRRERRRKEARAPLQTALDVFEQLGAVPWAERAGRELRATGQTARRRDDTSSAELTLQERQVIELVANGATNREAAAQLFLSPRTVEYHLRNVFMKLGISSRTELIRLQLEEGSPAPTG